MDPKLEARLDSLEKQLVVLTTLVLDMWSEQRVAFRQPEGPPENETEIPAASLCKRLEQAIDSADQFRESLQCLKNGKESG